MSDVEYTWPSTTFDAINIAMRDGEIIIEGIDGDQVKLDVDGLSRSYDAGLEPAGRWLQLIFWHKPGLQVHLRLPKTKAWVLEISAGRGQVKVTDVQARLQVMLGKGEIEIENGRGVFNLMSGNGQVKMKHCAEIEMPKRPPLPQSETEAQSSAHEKNTDPRREFRARRMKSRSRWDWDWDWDWDKSDMDWGAWGMQIGEKASAWAQEFAQSFSWMGWKEQQAGMSVQMGKGDAHLEDIEADTCSIGFGKGYVRLEQGRIANLDISTMRGDIECKTVLAVGEWEMKATHGDIHLSLPSDTKAKLDVATRHGDIHSNVSLVRVARPGPEARYGGRMVGAVGQSEASAATIGLTAMKGNIHIVLQSLNSRYTPKPRTESAPSYASVATPQTGVGNAKANPITGSSPITDETERPKDESPQPAYESHMAILQALSEGSITVGEAEQLLRSVKS
jgi:hypothetical protein